jgi:hypothetical protein
VHVQRLVHQLPPAAHELAHLAVEGIEVVHDPLALLVEPLSLQRSHPGEQADRRVPVLVKSAGAGRQRAIAASM